MPVMYLDESEHGDFLSVGGYYCSTGDVPRIEASWRSLKQGLGLEPGTPLKWSPQGPEKEALAAAGISVNEARSRAAGAIGQLPIQIVTIVLQERRTAYATRGSLSGGMIRQVVALWKRIHPHGGGVRHFYLRGVEFALQRFTEHVGTLSPQLRESSRLVLDDLNWARNQGRKTKQLMAKLAQLPETNAWVIRDWIGRGLDAAYDAYSRWYASGFSPPYDSLGTLGGLGFESSFYQCTDERSDAMQVADFLAGATGAFVSEVAREKLGVARDCVRSLRARFRASGTRFGSGMWGNGFLLWPSNPDLWNDLKGKLV